MEITAPPELLAYPLVARELTPDATVIEARGALCDGPPQIRVGEFARVADEIRTVVALMGKTVG